LVITDTDIKVPTYALKLLTHSPICWDPSTPQRSLRGAATVAGMIGARVRWIDCPPKLRLWCAKLRRLGVPPGKDRPEPVWHIEVLSTGKQVVVPPSIHPTTGYSYDWITPLGSLPILPESVHIAVEEALAISVRLSAYDAGAETRRELSNTGRRPGDDFSARTDWASLLERHGWTLVRRQGDVSYWRRPGKRDGCSASVNYGGRDVLYMFSSAAPPFEADRAYRKFTAYALLEYGGDFDAAAKVLRLQGYDDRRTVSETSARWPSRMNVEVA